MSSGRSTLKNEKMKMNEWNEWKWKKSKVKYKKITQFPPFVCSTLETQRWTVPLKPLTLAFALLIQLLCCTVCMNACHILSQQAWAPEAGRQYVNSTGDMTDNRKPFAALMIFIRLFTFYFWSTCAAPHVSWIKCRPGRLPDSPLPIIATDDLHTTIYNQEILFTVNVNN